MILKGMKNMKKRLLSITLSVLMLLTLNSVNSFACTAEEIEESPLFFFVDENGDVTQVEAFEYETTYYVNARSTNALNSVTFDTPNPSTNCYDLEDGEYIMNFFTSQSSYQMDKWFLPNSDGDLYLSGFVGDADGKLNLYTYRQAENEVWHIKVYSLQLHSTNTRARVFNGYVGPLNKSQAKYYTSAVVADSGNFGFGVLKASWEPITYPFDYVD